MVQNFLLFYFQKSSIGGKFWNEAVLEWGTSIPELVLIFSNLHFEQLPLPRQPPMNKQQWQKGEANYVLLADQYDADA